MNKHYWHDCFMADHPDEQMDEQVQKDYLEWWTYNSLRSVVFIKGRPITTLHEQTLVTVFNMMRYGRPLYSKPLYNTDCIPEEVIKEYWKKPVTAIKPYVLQTLPGLLLAVR